LGTWFWFAEHLNIVLGRQFWQGKLNFSALSWEHGSAEHLNIVLGRQFWECKLNFSALSWEHGSGLQNI